MVTSIMETEITSTVNQCACQPQGRVCFEEVSFWRFLCLHPILHLNLNDLDISLYTLYLLYYLFNVMPFIWGLYVSVFSLKGILCNTLYLKPILHLNLDNLDFGILLYILCAEWERLEIFLRKLEIPRDDFGSIKAKPARSWQNRGD